MKYYNDIAKTPLGIFVDCYVDGNTDSLRIDGDVPHETLAFAWEQMQAQFAVAMGSNEHRILLRLLKDTNELACIINQASMLIEVMYNAYHPTLGKVLNGLLKANIQWPENDREIINFHLNRCKSLMKPIEMRFEMKKAELDAISKKLSSNDNQKPTRAYFDLLLNLVEEHFSVPADYNILTGRFCDKIKRMNEQLRKQKYK
jgi:hypothetical protein